MSSCWKIILIECDFDIILGVFNGLLVHGPSKLICKIGVDWTVSLVVRLKTSLNGLSPFKFGPNELD